MNRQALCDAPNKCHIAFISVTENVTVRYHHHKTVGIQNQKKVQMPNKQKKFLLKRASGRGLVGEQLKFVGGVYKTLKATR